MKHTRAERAVVVKRLHRLLNAQSTFFSFFSFCFALLYDTFELSDEKSCQGTQVKKIAIVQLTFFILLHEIHL